MPAMSSRIVIAVSVIVILLAGGSIIFTMQKEEIVAGNNEEPATGQATSTAPSPVANTTTPGLSSSTRPQASTIGGAAATATVPVSQILEATRAPQAGVNGWKGGIATVFWAGEGATDENGFISNTESAWDEEWKQHFGGEDHPECREGFSPCGFTPKENPFYVALPYNDLDDEGDKKADANRIPWNVNMSKSVLKNRWVEVSVRGKSCFGQWEDVGPFYEDDIAYVFGSAQGPKNTEGEGAGIDLSPAMRDCLGVKDVSEVLWRHVAGGDVPSGPWKEIVTTRLSQ